jgi:hypothetical protein
VAKKHVGELPKAFRQMAVGRLETETASGTVSRQYFPGTAFLRISDLFLTLFLHVPSLRISSPR